MSCRLLTISILIASSAASAEEPGRLRQPAGVYDVLQQNTWYLPTNDGAAKLLVTDIGDGSPVVFLHGGPGNDFQYVIDALLPHLRDHRFLLFDDRGSLLSPVKADRVDTITLDHMVEDLEELRKATDQDRLTIFGHSFGSLLALAYFKAHPDHVERLVLTGSFPPDTSLPELAAVMRPRQKALRERPAVADTLALEGLSGPDDTLTARQRSMKARITGNAALNVMNLNRWRQNVGGGVYYNRLVDERVASSISGRLDFGEALLAHPVPVTIIQGDCDYIDPGASAWRSFAAAHPTLKIRVNVIAAASHYAWIDGPAAFRRALARGLSRIP
ncbi:MAG: alpha/beta hydrolase [Sphingomonas sp.]